MPRDGLSQYAPPPGTNGITNYTIESTKYNGFVADVTQDLNLPRPIVAGGTGANNARDAMTSLQGDVAYQVVTNYDAYAFVSGSFYSAAGATSAPTANAFIGQCYTSDPAVVPPAVPAGQNMFIEARDVTTGKKYIRQKIAGVWQAWTAGIALDIDAAYVNVTGDTMTGSLVMQAPAKAVAGNSAVNFVSAASDNPNPLSGAVALFTDPTPANRRLQIQCVEQGIAWRNVTLAENGGNVGIGKAVPATALDVAGNITAAATATTGTYYFGNSGTKYLNYDGANFTLSGGALSVGGGISCNTLTANGNIASAVSAATGTYYFGSSGTKYLTYDGANFSLVGGGLITGAISASGSIAGTNITSFSSPTTGSYYFGQSGTKVLGYDGVNFTLSGGALTVGGAIVGGNITASGTVASTVSATTGTFYFGTPGPKYLNYDGTNFQLFGGNVQTPGVTYTNGATPMAQIAHNGASWNFYSNMALNVGQYMLPGGSAWVAFSDARQAYKVSAKQIDNVLDRLGGVNLYTNIGPSGEKEVFFKAQELFLTLPELVAEGKGAKAKDANYVPTGPGDENGWGVMYDRASCVALQAIKELLARVEVLEAQLAAK